MKQDLGHHWSSSYVQKIELEEAYLGLCKVSMMELSCENSGQL